MQCGLSYWLLPGLQTVSRLLFFCFWLALAGCSTYKLDVPQGNIVTDDMVSRLREGQTRAQVRFLLGSPMLTDPFHQERWDYYYQLRENGKVTQKRNFTVWFEGDSLKRWEGQTQAAAAPAAPTPAKP